MSTDSNIQINSFSVHSPCTTFASMTSFSLIQTAPKPLNAQPETWATARPINLQDSGSAKSIQSKTITKTFTQANYENQVFASGRTSQSELTNEHFKLVIPSASRGTFLLPQVTPRQSSIILSGSHSFQPKIKRDILSKPPVQFLPLAVTPSNDIPISKDSSSNLISPQSNTGFEVPEPRTPTLLRPNKRIKRVAINDASAQKVDAPQACVQSSSVSQQLLTEAPMMAGPIFGQQPTSQPSSFPSSIAMTVMPQPMDISESSSLDEIQYLQQIRGQAPRAKTQKYHEALNYLFGRGVAKDPEKAIKNFQLTAFCDGDRSAFFYVGYCYEHGIVVKQDIDTANSYYACALGKLDQKAIGLDENILAALKQYKPQASVQNTPALRQFATRPKPPSKANVLNGPILGQHLSSPPDFFASNIAMSQMPQASAASKPSSLDEIQCLEQIRRQAPRAKTEKYHEALNYLFGRGVAKDPEKAIENFKLTAFIEGDPAANYYMGYCYEHGIVVKQDKHIANRYYKCAKNAIIDRTVLEALQQIGK
jgi:hypothetical protein